jgi:hypothetical protein
MSDPQQSFDNDDWPEDDWRYERPGKAEKKEEEKEAEKEDEKERGLEEKWRRDPLSAVVWASILIWAGLAFLAANLGLFARFEWMDGWGLAFIGAGLIVLLEVAVRLLVPAYRRPVGGSLIVGFILLGIGLGNLVRADLVFPMIIIAIGIGILLRNFARGNR